MSLLDLLTFLVGGWFVGTLVAMGRLDDGAEDFLKACIRLVRSFVRRPPTF